VKHILRLVGMVAYLWVWPLPISMAVAWDGSGPDQSTKILLQSAVVEFIDRASDADGGFRYIDRKTGALHTAYPGALHPKIIPIGHDYFLCIEMLDAKGAVKLVDFVLRQSAAGWLVVDVIIDRRDLVKKALASAE